jgi:hypothetical protein
MKAILIDVYNREVREVEVDKKNELHSMYKHIDCEYVDRVRIDEHDDIWVDDEGLLTLDDDSMFFVFKGYDGVLAGNGLIMGVNRKGESIEPRISIEEVRSSVRFLTITEVRLMVLN